MGEMEDGTIFKQTEKQTRVSGRGAHDQKKLNT